MERDVIKKKRPLVCFILKTSLSKGKLTLKGIKKTKMEDSRGEIIFSEGHLILTTKSGYTYSRNFFFIFMRNK